MDGGPSWNPIHDHEGSSDLEYPLLSRPNLLPDSFLLSLYLHALPLPPNSTSSPYIPSTPSIMSAVDAPVENLTEPDAAGGTEIAQETQNVGQLPQNNETAAVGSEKKWPGWPGESVFRILVPSPKVGGIIGRKGEYIKKTCEESRARIKILDGPPGAPERAVLCRPLRLQIFLQCVSKRKNKLPGCWDQVLGSVYAPGLSGKNSELE